MSKQKQHVELSELMKFAEMFHRDNIDYDKDFETILRRNISERDDSYTELLGHFVKITKARNIIKEIHKWLYFWIITILMVVFLGTVCGLLLKLDMTNITMRDSVAIVIPLLISFTSVIISIPLIVTKYLFSPKEDKRITKLIWHTQKHDLSGKKILEDFKQHSGKNEIGDALISKVMQEVKKLNRGEQDSESESAS